MTNEELEKLLPLAAKAMGLKGTAALGTIQGRWIPAFDSEQCAEMNAALDHDTTWLRNCVAVGTTLLLDEDGWIKHNGTTADKLRAWMEASVRAAARVGERSEQEVGK